MSAQVEVERRRLAMQVLVTASRTRSARSRKKTPRASLRYGIICRASHKADRRTATAYVQAIGIYSKPRRYAENRLLSTGSIDPPLVWKSLSVHWNEDFASFFTVGDDYFRFVGASEVLIR